MAFLEKGDTPSLERLYVLFATERQVQLFMISSY